tara:strand:- start:408 stop:761 length:354 start_codon:yes stop_codon:yes gene_type:complete
MDFKQIKLIEKKMNTQENNKMIAEFMGLSHCSEGWITIPYHVREEVAEEEIVDELRYHTSWDWLMPVIQECLIGEAEHSEDVSNLAIKNIYESICNQDISLAHKSVVEFINQYNKNK